MLSLSQRSFAIKKKRLKARNYRTLRHRQALWLIIVTRCCDLITLINWLSALDDVNFVCETLIYSQWRVMDDKKRATVYNNHNNIIIMTAFARLILTKHQTAAASNYGSSSFRLLSATIKLSKVEPKAHKRALNFESDHLSFSLDSDSNSIINFFVRDNRKRLKRINIPSDQNTFKPKSFISLTIFISLSFISSNQSTSKPRSFTSFIFINIIRK